MSLADHTAAEQRRAAARRRLAVDATYALPGAALVAHVKAAVSSAAAKSKHRASAWEREALIQVVTVSALRGGSLAPTWAGKRTAPTRARDVLAWIDLAERRPLTARAADERRLARGAGTRQHLERVTADRIADSRTWRDTASGYRTRAGASVPTTSDDGLDERPAGGWLADELGDEQLPVSDRQLADAVAATYGLAHREQRAVSVALLAAMPAPDGEPVNLLTIANALGVAHGTARNWASEGARLLAHVATGAELADRIRTVAASLGLAPPARALRALLTGQPQPLYPTALAAAWAVERLRPTYCPSGARSMPERAPRDEQPEQPLHLLAFPAEQPERTTSGAYAHPVPGVRHVPEQRTAEQDTVSDDAADRAWMAATAAAECGCPACR